MVTRQREKHIINYNGEIANGGMEYVKTMLDIGGETAYLDCIDCEEPQIIKWKKGYSSMDILNFCNDHKITCFWYDWIINLDDERIYFK